MCVITIVLDNGLPDTIRAQSAQQVWILSTHPWSILKKNYSRAKYYDFDSLLLFMVFQLYWMFAFPTLILGWSNSLHGAQVFSTYVAPAWVLVHFLLSIKYSTRLSSGLGSTYVILLADLFAYWIFSSGLGEIEHPAWDYFGGMDFPIATSAMPVHGVHVILIRATRHPLVPSLVCDVGCERVIES